MADMYDERHSVVLANGVKMPLLGFGCYQIPAAQAERCVLDALEVGYRHIDTAEAYMNEKEVGAAVRGSGLARSDIFVTTKVWICNFGREKTKQAVYRSLERMGLDYLDLVLLHQGFADYYGAFKALQELYAEGVLKSIGVSNFFPRFLLDLVKFGDAPAPMVNQVELHPYFQQPQAREYMRQNKVQAQAWAPLAELRNNILHDPVLSAIAQKHGKTVAQVILRYLTQNQVVALVKSVHKERMLENLESLEFDLDADDMRAIAALDQGKPLFFDHGAPEMVDVFHGFNEHMKPVLAV